MSQKTGKNGRALAREEVWGQGVAEVDEASLPPCPKCGAPMEAVRGEGKIAFYGCTKYRETGCRGRWFADRTDPAHPPFFHACPECHQGLKKGIGKNGQPYCACFESDDHKSVAPIFFSLDGTPRPVLEAREQFACPECSSPLVYFVVQNGRHKGKKTFACLCAAKHASKRAHYWEDNNGRPQW